MINEERGEFEIEIGGASYGMRPSWEAIQAFEQGANMSLLQLAAAAERGALDLRACAVIVTESVKAWGRATANNSARGFQIEVVTPLLVEEGMFVVQPKLALMLYMAATGGLTGSGEIKATTKNPTTEAGGASAGSPALRSGGSRKTGGNRRP